MNDSTKEAGAAKGKVELIRIDEGAIRKHLERINREIRRRTRVVGSFPDGESALMLVAARLRHIASTKWGTRPYMDMGHLYALEQEREGKNLELKMNA